MDNENVNLRNDDLDKQKKEVKNSSDNNFYESNYIHKGENSKKTENILYMNYKEEFLKKNGVNIQLDMFNSNEKNKTLNYDNNIITNDVNKKQAIDLHKDVNDKEYKNDEDKKIDKNIKNEENINIDKNIKNEENINIDKHIKNDEDIKTNKNIKNDEEIKTDKHIKNDNNKEKRKKNKKVMNINYIVQYNRYKPTRIDVFKKRTINSFIKKNQNQYINCNFRYYVSEKDYLIQNIIGENIKWDKIEKVDYIIFDNTSISCPICLENNIISPRITKCRHIFCFFCILKYFIEEEKKTWKRCPICFEIINENDLRMVKFHYVKNYNIDDSISLCLLYTENNKINLKSDKLCFNNNFDITNKNFVKNNKVIDYKYFVNIDYMNKNLTSVSQNHSDQVIKLNLNLGVQFSKIFYIYNPLAIWIKDLSIFNFILTNKKMKSFISDVNVIEKAILDIKLRMSDYLNIPVEKLNPELNIDEEYFDSFYLYDNLAHDVYDSIEQIKKEMKLEIELSEYKKITKDKEFHIDSEKNNDSDLINLKDLNQVYFYQCIDGQCIYLDPFILKLLFYEYGYNVNELPTFLYNKKITYIDSFELDEKIRKRYCILSHLPLGVNIMFVSLNLDDMLSERTKNHFSKEISIRKAKHINILKKKKKEENHFKLLAEEEIERKEKSYWNLSSNKMNIEYDSNNIGSNTLNFYNDLKEEKYLHGELSDDTLFKYDDFLIEKKLIKTNSKEANYNTKNRADIAKNMNKKNMKNESKRNNSKNIIKNKNKNITTSKIEINNVKNENNQLPKRSFLEIAKTKCDVNVNKAQVTKKKEEKLSIGSGSVSINLLDLINSKESQKKKKKK
ncbi:E3 ubiquitin-protein ligase, putative [Plasmodium relictum]|uniref:E3 ubiquitin-protein ligase, putative n=1 Tax=Plasmodium relictum TaxID=85471 RepID=A0A1J1H4R1_PLARL|nr:E3 ubiquitin-protein ligase, putative [Plasmodium relictum]CRG99673.1 E3 ubiquitin-protein ligase, putative [Plasmodium relictum]